MSSSEKTKFERSYRCTRCGGIQTYMRDTFADKISDLPKCDVDGCVMMPAQRGESGPEIRPIDAKRYIGHDGWAMLVKVGDVVDDRKVDLAFIEHYERTLPRRVEVLRGISGDQQANQVRLGSTIDHQTRVNGTEFWIRFDESIASENTPRRAVLGLHPNKGGAAIAATPRVPCPGDREQRGPAPALARLAASPEEMTTGMFKPETLVEYLDQSFPGARWHETGSYLDRSLHGQKLAVFAQMLQQLDPNYQPSSAQRLQYAVARDALEAFLRQGSEKLEAFQALAGYNPINVIRDVLIAMSGRPRESEATTATPSAGYRQMETSMKVFISHSSADGDAASAFVELVRAALLIHAKEIRCTSVDGYKLAGGTNANEQLRQEVFDAETFVALLSPKSMASVYVMFELGARWGANRHLVPLMIGGVEPSSLKAPLSAIHAISGASEGDMYQLVETLATQLNVSPEQPSAYMKALKAFMETAKPRP